jgi:LCP family protein required for cell wall assembly
MGMTRRDRFRTQAAPTARARRMREAARRDPGRLAREDDTDEVVVRQRRSLPLKRILAVVVVGTLILLLAGGVLLWQRVAAFNDRVSTASAASSALFGPLNGSDRVNVVMIGYAGEEKHGGTYLADSINILSIDPKTDTTTMVPIPRDLWIEGAPDMPDNGKVNESFALGYAKGGIQEAGSAVARVLTRVTGLRIDHWMAIDFAGFREMVDAVGGVTVNNPVAFSYTWNETDFHAGKWNGGSFKKGTLHLNGTQALDYARSRYTSVPAESSDFARSVRQQRIMGSLRTRLGSGGIGAIGPGLSLMDALGGRLKTDLSAIDLFLLSGHLQPDRRIELKEDVILQATRSSAGQYILAVIGRQSATDYAPLKTWLAQQLAKPIAVPSASPRGG